MCSQNFASMRSICATASGKSKGAKGQWHKEKMKTKTLSEFEAKKLLSTHGIPVVQEVLAKNLNEAKTAVTVLGFPVVLKACSPEILHKTEKKLVEVNLYTLDSMCKSFDEIQKRADGDLEGVLIQRQITDDKRECIAGLVRDEAFGPCVMFGGGGIYAEAMQDVAFRVAPVAKLDAFHLIHDTEIVKLLKGVRGQKPVNIPALADILIKLGNLGMEDTNILEADINPIMFLDGEPVCVDALVVLLP